MDSGCWKYIVDKRGEKKHLAISTWALLLSIWRIQNCGCLGCFHVNREFEGFNFLLMALQSTMFAGAIMEWNMGDGEYQERSNRSTFRSSQAWSRVPPRVIKIDRNLEFVCNLALTRECWAKSVIPLEDTQGCFATPISESVKV